MPPGIPDPLETSAPQGLEMSSRGQRPRKRLNLLPSREHGFARTRSSTLQSDTEGFEQLQLTSDEQKERKT
jgi:hypothetical protein